ncbi:22489_t:CDS:2 [Rhizophagus irregularis]|uniref:Uncharacterized protein n=1 Tax=Rhizophagus irregularis (strain DAOM 181602 / DAOM 197198 / MUCL 43194) TaxID=747089 RepID=U9UFG7_RHIID|nr:22489_t:CDS:2 [Rhizophagus irregularis]
MSLFIIPTKRVTLADYSFCDLKDIFEWQESYFSIVSNVSDSYAESFSVNNTDIIEEDHDNILKNVGKKIREIILTLWTNTVF